MFKGNGLDFETFKSISSSKLFGGDMPCIISSEVYIQKHDVLL